MLLHVDIRFEVKVMGDILGYVLIGFILMAAVAILYLPVYLALEEKSSVF